MEESRSPAPPITSVELMEPVELLEPTELLVPLEPLAALVDIFATDANGRLRVPVFGGANAPTNTWIFQAATFDGTTFDLSNALSVVVGSF